MTREEAIQILSTRDAHGVLCGYTSGVTEALDMAVEALHDRPKGDWIPCSERLPKEGEKVLASTTNTAFTHVFKGTLRNSDSWRWNNNTIKTIYAWMPLPKPYKGGDDE